MFAQHYNAARKNLLPPLAAAYAAWQSSPSVAAQIKTLHPSGAALLFAAAYAAGLMGSLAAPLVVAAFLAGLYLVKAQAVPIIATSPRPVVAIVPSSAAEVVKVAAHPLADQLAATGLIVREVKLGQPVANGRAAKVSTK